MSISDVAAPGDLSAPDVFSPDRLVDLLRTLKISSVDKYQSDACLTLEMINQAFDGEYYRLSSLFFNPLTTCSARIRHFVGPGRVWHPREDVHSRDVEDVEAKRSNRGKFCCAP